MLKIYTANREKEYELLEFLGEFPKSRVFINYKIAGKTKKVRKTKWYRVTNFPI